MTVVGILYREALKRISVNYDKRGAEALQELALTTLKSAEIAGPFLMKEGREVAGPTSYVKIHPDFFVHCGCGTKAYDICCTCGVPLCDGCQDGHGKEHD